ncbi:polyketide synthase [Mycena galopus ATCC 62051]|nr:polyketide synthase [Mycena galopus ATCC 62051]
MSTPVQNPKPVAVVGVSAEFPSGTLSETNFDHKSFFQFLLAGQDAYERIPKDKFNIDGWQGSHLGQILPEKGCFLKNVHLFDHFEFGISSKDAFSMAPATRKLVEHSFLSLLDSGINSRSQNVGVYTSGIVFDILSAADADEFDVRDGFGGGAAAVANRVSYQLDLLGPSIPVDTACSSSLTALHLGVQALRAGDCEAAVIGGSQINHRFLDWVHYSQLSILSSGGKSSPFDASADGFGRGEAVVVFVIKLLEDAIRDGDKIYATVLNTAVNSTGSAGPVKMPIAESQAATMLAAYKGISRSPTEVDFVECHATGTSVGDPIEANWIGKYFKRDSELLIGSVKGNIGHTEITSFLASFTKVCSMFSSNLIPPQANYKTPNPTIHWEEYKMRVPTEVEEFKARNTFRKRLVSINGFGLLGANGHVVVESPPHQVITLVSLVPLITANCRIALQTVQTIPLPKGRPVLLVAAGLSPRSATAIAADLAKLAADLPDELPALSNIFGRRARQLTWRTAAVSTSDRAFAFPPPRFVPRAASPLVFVFSGQGPQHIKMGRQLFKIYPAFQKSILRMDKVHIEVMGTSIVHELGFFGDAHPKETLPDTWPVTLTVPSIAMIQMALVDLFTAFGIRPNMVFGHSAGEAAMLYASGAVPLELAMEIAIRRSRAMTLVEGSGGMAAVSCISSVAREIIRGVLIDAGPGEVLELGCYNAPEAVTISGTQTMIDRAIAVAQDRGMFARQIKARVPGHCNLLEPCKARYVQEMETAFFRYPGSHAPTIPTYSTQTGSRWETEFTPEYMWTNGRVPVQFEQTVTAVVAEMPEAIFIEIGPHPALSSYISAMGAKPGKVLCPMRRTKSVSEFNELTDLFLCIGNLSCLGVNTINFNLVNGTDALEISKPLPGYPFAAKSIPFYSESSRLAVKQRRSRKGPLNSESFAMNALTHPDLAEHVVRGEPILPATAFLEMIFEEGARTIWDVELRSLLPLLPEKVLEVEVKSDGHAWTIVSCQGGGRNPRLHAIGFMTTEITDEDIGPIDLASIRARCTVADITNIYAVLASTATFGPLYRRIEACCEGDREILFQVRGNAAELNKHYKYVFHPAVLDACLHGLLHPVFTGNADKSVFYLPSHIGRVIIYDRAIENGMPEVLYSHILPHKWTPESIACDAFIVNERGERLITLRNCILAKHWAGAVPTRPETCYECIYQPLGMPPAELAPTCLTQRDYAFLDDIVTPARAKEANGNVNEYGNDHANGDVVADFDQDHKTFQEMVQYITSESAELKSSAILGLFPTALYACVVAAGQIFHHAVKSGKQVFRLLDIGDATGSLHKILTILASEYPALRLDYTACGHENSSDVRSMSFNVDSVTKQAGLLPNSYDLVIEAHILGFASQLDKSLQYLNGLLVPGGFLIAVEVNGLPQTPGGKWIDHVFSPQKHWSGLRSGRQYRRRTPCEWDSHLSKTNFRVVAGRTETSLFLTLQAQKPSLPRISSSTSEKSSTVEKPVVFSFELSRALDLQQIILDVGSSNGSPSKIWIEATSETFDGAAAIGFSRSLMRELLTIEIRLVLFDSAWNTQSRIYAIQQLSRLGPLEPEIALDGSGNVLVPRLRSYGPRPREILDPTKYWTVKQAGTVLQSSPPSPGPDQVLVKISCLSREEGGLQGLVGTVVRSRSSQWPVSARVVAVVPSTCSNLVLVHAGQLAEVPDADERNIAVKSLKQLQVVVLHAGEFASAVRRVLEHLGVKPLLTAPSLPLSLPRLCPGDIIMCGLPAESARTIPRIRGVSTFNWNDTDHGALAAVDENPWLVGTVMETHLTRVAAVNVNYESLTPEQFLPPILDVSRSLCLADDKFFYLIIGGIGSLGLNLAIWMYRKGARHIVLTSRKGVARLAGSQNRAMRGAVEYLASFTDLDLRLEACDASSVEALTHLIDALDYPLAGCILAAAGRHDCLFSKQDPKGFPLPFKSKTEGYFALEKVVAIEKLDFLLAISSIAGFGSAGLTNYASANTGIEYLTARYPNAWAFVSPGIADSAVGFDILAAENSLVEMWGASIMNSYEICLCLEDGLLRMANGQRISLYVPSLNWDELYTAVNESPLYTYLVNLDATQDKVKVEDPYEVLQKIVIKFVNASMEDFERNVPLTSYGLDSLSAAGMSTALKPYLKITQIQLLGDLSLDDLVSRMRDTEQTVIEASVPTTTEKPFAWDALNQPGQTVLKLVIGSGIPLIVLHGGAGDIAAFRAIQEQFTTPLWAIQPTPDAPLENVDTLAQFYFEKIKEARPAGPYRIAGFSASSMVTLRLVRLLEANEDEIAQFTFIDHFPMIFATALHGFFENVASFEDLLTFGRKAGVAMTAYCCARDSAPIRRTYGENLIAASHGLPCTQNALESWEWITRLSATNLRTLVEFAGGWSVWASADGVARAKAARDRVVAEITNIRSPINVLIANSGLRALLGPEWNDLGVSLAQRDTRIVYFEAGHFDLFQNADFSHSLEFDWVDLQQPHVPTSLVHNPLLNDFDVVFKILDTMALQTMTDTLKRNPRVGDEISRRRLFDVTEEFVRAQPESTWTDEEYALSRKLFPVFFEITDRISKVHPAIMESPAAAIEALYSDDLLDAFYRDSPSFIRMNQEAAKYFKSLASIPDSTRKRPMRVLEVGAGVGGLTKFMIETLCDIPNCQVEYTVTDLSFSLAADLAESFTYKNITPRILDISKPPAEQGLQLAHYDVITGFNVVHAVADLNATLLHLNTLLAPGGHLLVVDTDGSARTSNPLRAGAIWNDFVWGSFQGWFGFTDDRAHCTMDEDQWRDRLSTTGYGNVTVCREDAGRLHGFFGFRIYAFTKKIFIHGIIWSVSLALFVMRLLFFVTSLRTPIYSAYTIHWEWLLTMVWSLSVETDVVITTTLVVVLYKERFHKTVALLDVDKLIVWLIETGMSMGTSEIF